MRRPGDGPPRREALNNGHTLRTKQIIYISHSNYTVSMESVHLETRTVTTTVTVHQELQYDKQTELQMEFSLQRNNRTRKR